MVSLIRSHPSLFSYVPSSTNILKHDIDVGSASPIKQHAYRCPLAKIELMKKEANYLLENGLAVPSCSPWSSPCLLAPKSDGTPLFCTDYCKVNAVTVQDSFPLPRMEDCIDIIGPAMFITKLDLLKGYWQVPLTPRASEISAFVTPDHFLQYTVMPFGVRNVPATFQDFPTSRRELRRFLGMAGYYRCFCKNFSVAVNPLTSLCSPKVPFVWSAECQYAFEDGQIEHGLHII